MNKIVGNSSHCSIQLLYSYCWSLTTPRTWLIQYSSILLSKILLNSICTTVSTQQYLCGQYLLRERRLPYSSTILSS